MKVKEYRIKNQTINNESIRASIYQLAQENGGLIGLAEKSNLSYNALWEQLNRNAGVLAYTIPKIVSGTGDLRLLQLLADACGCLVIRKVLPAKGVRSIHKHELNLYSQLTAAIETIELAYANDGFIDREEYRQINYKMNELRRRIAELAEKIKKGARI